MDEVAKSGPGPIRATLALDMELEGPPGWGIGSWVAQKVHVDSTVQLGGFRGIRVLVLPHCHRRLALGSFAQFCSLP